MGEWGCSFCGLCHRSVKRRRGQKKSQFTWRHLLTAPMFHRVEVKWTNETIPRTNRIENRPRPEPWRATVCSKSSSFSIWALDPSKWRMFPAEKGLASLRQLWLPIRWAFWPMTSHKFTVTVAANQVNLFTIHDVTQVYSNFGSKSGKPFDHSWRHISLQWLWQQIRWAFWPFMTSHKLTVTMATNQVNLFTIHDVTQVYSNFGSRSGEPFEHLWRPLLPKPKQISQPVKNVYSYNKNIGFPKSGLILDLETFI